MIADVLLAGLAVAGIFAVKKWPKPLTLLGVLAVAGFASLCIALVAGGDMFGAMRVLAAAIFIYAVILLMGASVLLWKTYRKSAIAAALVAAVTVIVGVDAFYIEPHWLEVSRVRIESPKLTRPLKVVILADLQTDEIGAYEKDVLRRVMAEKPDLILLAGDYIQSDSPQGPQSLLRQELNEMRFKGALGTVAVQGNCDPPKWEHAFAGSEVTAVQDTQVLSFHEVRVTALSMADSFNERLKVPDQTGFHIALGHSPDFALGDVKADLLVAGHTHGGQVRLPFIGPLLTLSSVPRSWATGVTSLSGNRTLIVSRGVGMERGRAPRLRFLCRPELVVVDLVPAGQ